MSSARRQHNHRYGWFAACIGVAALIVLYGLYYSYSDRYIAMWMAAAVLALGWMTPRFTAVGVLALAVVSSGVGLFLGTHRDRYLDDFLGIRLGMERSAVVAMAGPPQFVLASRDDLYTVDVGYSVPSPYRYRHNGPIDVYLGASDSAFWVFYRDDRVVDVFVGGS